MGTSKIYKYRYAWCVFHCRVWLQEDNYSVWLKRKLGGQSCSDSGRQALPRAHPALSKSVKRMSKYETLWNAHTKIYHHLPWYSMIHNMYIYICMIIYVYIIHDSVFWICPFRRSGGSPGWVLAEFGCQLTTTLLGWSLGTSDLVPHLRSKSANDIPMNSIDLWPGLET